MDPALALHWRDTSWMLKALTTWVGWKMWPDEVRTVR